MTDINNMIFLFPIIIGVVPVVLRIFQGIRENRSRKDSYTVDAIDEMIKSGEIKKSKINIFHKILLSLGLAKVKQS